MEAGESEYSGLLKTRKLLIFRHAKNALASGIAPNWNVSGTRLFVIFGLCFAKILYALKIARFPVATDIRSGLSLHPPSAKILSRGNPRAVYLYI